MEIILLLIYAGIVWLLFFKFKLLPWTFVSQVIVFTLPIIGMTALILILNVVAPPHRTSVSSTMSSRSRRASPAG